MGDSATGIVLPNSEQFYLNNAQGEQYLIQISWPLLLKPHDPDCERKELPILYIVDGNALFLTATEAAWRRAAESHYAGGGIVVAIGYPLEGTGKVYHRIRRCVDLTPPTPEPMEGYGGADLFLDFITNTLRPEIKARFPRLSFSREALFGHSYGGLLALHTLFTRPDMFDCYITSSPSIWWFYQYILNEAKAFVKDYKSTPGEKLPTLIMYLGSLEQNPCQWNDETPEHFEGRKRDALIFRMRENADILIELLKDSGRLHAITLNEYEGEEHGTVMACSMSRGLTAFFEEWPLSLNCSTS